MGMYSLLQQMFDHSIATKICLVDGIPFAKDEFAF
jgi:hypothetical protein